MYKEEFIPAFIKCMESKLIRFMPDDKPVDVMLEEAHDIVRMNIDHIQMEMKRITREE